MSNLKANIATVNLGHIQIQGLLGSDKKFYVAVPQISEHFQFLNKNSVRDIKGQLGCNFG